MKKFLRSAALGVATLALMSGMALAAEPPWTYVEAGYLGVDVDDLEGSGDNVFVGGAFGGKMWHVIGQYSDGEIADGIDRRDWRLGVGWHGLLGESADLLAEAYYVDSSVTISPAPFNGGDLDDNGYRLTGGVRWRPLKLIEVDAFVNYTDLSDLGSETSYELRAIIYVWRIGIGAGYETFDDADQYNAFVRFNF